MSISTKILLVEDDKYIALALKIRLQAEGFDVHVVSGCEAAIQSAYECQPDIAVVDFNLPDGNGLELLQHFSKEFEQRPIASIMMTASKKDGLREQALSQGVHAYFEKPFKSADLIDAIKSIGSALQASNAA